MFLTKKKSNKKSDFSLKKLKYGLKFFLISNKLKKTKDINEWFEKRKKYLLNLKLDKFINFEGKFDSEANIYFFNHQSFVEILSNIIKKTSSIIFDLEEDELLFVITNYI